MKHVVLISCVSKKRPSRAPARDLYQSALFKKSLAYAEQLDPDLVLILSAEHHVLDLDEEIEPYDTTLNRMGVEDRRRWSARVLEELRERADLDRDRFTILAGQNYRKHLVPHLANHEVPLAGMRIGEQLGFLTRALAR